MVPVGVGRNPGLLPPTGAAFFVLPQGDAGQSAEGSSITRLASGQLGPGGAQVAQLVEHATENRSVGGSIPPLGTSKINDLRF